MKAHIPCIFFCCYVMMHTNASESPIRSPDKRFLSKSVGIPVPLSRVPDNTPQSPVYFFSEFKNDEEQLYKDPDELIKSLRKKIAKINAQNASSSLDQPEELNLLHDLVPLNDLVPPVESLIGRMRALEDHQIKAAAQAKYFAKIFALMVDTLDVLVKENACLWTQYNTLSKTVKEGNLALEHQINTKLRTTDSTQSLIYHGDDSDEE